MDENKQRYSAFLASKAAQLLHESSFRRRNYVGQLDHWTAHGIKGSASYRENRVFELIDWFVGRKSQELCRGGARYIGSKYAVHN
jgi:hypothetical protein